MLRHVEMYLFAEPGAVEPAGELLSGPLHTRQHAHHRQLRRDAGEPLGGYTRRTSCSGAASASTAGGTRLGPSTS